MTLKEYFTQAKIPGELAVIDIESPNMSPFGENEVVEIDGIPYIKTKVAFVKSLDAQRQISIRQLEIENDLLNAENERLHAEIESFKIKMQQTHIFYRNNEAELRHKYSTQFDRAERLTEQLKEKKKLEIDEDLKKQNLKQKIKLENIKIKVKEQEQKILELKQKLLDLNQKAQEYKMYEGIVYHLCLDINNQEDKMIDAQLLYERIQVRIAKIKELFGNDDLIN